MAGPKRKIYRGGVDENRPHVYEAVADVSGIIPGNLVSVNATDEFIKAAQGAYIYIADAPPCFDPLDYTYAAGETVFAYVPRSRDVYLMRAVAGLIGPKDTPLYSNAAGQVTVTNPGSAQVIGYLHYAQDVAATANELVDVRIR